MASIVVRRTPRKLRRTVEDRIIDTMDYLCELQTLRMQTRLCLQNMIHKLPHGELRENIVISLGQTVGLLDKAELDAEKLTAALQAAQKNGAIDLVSWPDMPFASVSKEVDRVFPRRLKLA